MANKAPRYLPDSVGVKILLRNCLVYFLGKYYFICENNLEIFDENGDSSLKMPFDEDHVYIIPTAQEKPMKLVFENDEFIWKGEVNPIDTD